MGSRRVPSSGQWTLRKSLHADTRQNNHHTIEATNVEEEEEEEVVVVVVVVVVAVLVVVVVLVVVIWQVAKLSGQLYSLRHYHQLPNLTASLHQVLVTV